MLRQELRIIIRGRNFWIATMVMFLCFCGFSVPYWVAYDLPIAYMPSALHLSVGGIFFGGVMLLIPFCSAFVCVENQSDEVCTSFFQWTVFRCSCVKYSACKLSAAMLGGAIAVMLAFAVHALMWHFIALPYNPVEYPEHAFFSEGTLYYLWQQKQYAWPIYLSMSIGIGLSGGLWAIVGLTAAVWISDKILAISIPVGLYYLWFKRVITIVFGIRLPSPDALYNDALTPDIIVSSLLTHAVFFIIAVLLYWFGVKRRAQYE